MAIIINKILYRIASFYPNLKRDIRIAHLKTNPQEFIYKALKIFTAIFSWTYYYFFFLTAKADLSPILLPVAFTIFFILAFNLHYLKLKVRILQRQKEIDREVLFAGQYLLIKLYSGKPLLNALIDTTRSYGVASKYIREIVDDIETGSPIEKALQSAMTYSPSEKLRSILFHINNALRLGIDVTKPLSAVLDEIIKAQEIEVIRYGKKVNTLVLFYMLAAVVMPSIGMTIFIALASFINFTIGAVHFLAALFFIIIIQLIFIAVFRAIRPTINL